MLKAAQIFTNNMVLQREKSISVWGSGEDGKTVCVSIADNRSEAVVKDGKWSVKLPPMAAGGEYQMHISDGEQTITFYHVMIGEVWFLGGQSNMELEIQNAKDGKALLDTLDESTPVRYYYTPKVGTAEDADREGEKTCWNTASPERSKCWSAVGLHFALKLSKELGVTVGLIGCNWGGTSASCWVDRQTLENDKTISSYIEEYDEKIKGKTMQEMVDEYRRYEKENDEWNKKSAELYKQQPDIEWSEVCRILGENKWPGPMGEINPFRPTAMYYHMVSRIYPYTIKGFLYYQGESDDHKPDSYYRLLTSLISLWREKWEDDTLPFIMVQLPAFKFKNDPDYKHWCKIREAQMKAFRTVKNTGIAVIYDCGELDNIHPTDKKPVGERLCLQAQRIAYKMDVPAFAPMFKDCVAKGDTLTLSFDYAEDGFVVKGGAPKGFEIAGADGEFTPAAAEINGSQITARSDLVKNPCHVRYNWFNYAETTIYGKNDIPLAPFCY